MSFPKSAVLLLIFVWTFNACTGSLFQGQQNSLQAIRSLQNGSFEEAQSESAIALRENPANTSALLVDAILQYQKAINSSVVNFRMIINDAMQFVTMGRGPGLDYSRMRILLDQTELDLAAVEKKLQHVSTDQEVSLELCLACWEKDWDLDGKIDQSDRLLFQIEKDSHGNLLAPDDSRRKPTFRFDIGDVFWARAWVSFQRGLADLFLAYEWNELDRIFSPFSTEQKKIEIKLREPARIAQAKQRFIEGIQYAEQARLLYLAETDDDREWVPSPRQTNHPIPLSVDETTYNIWVSVLQEMKLLINGTTGLSLAEIVSLGDEKVPNPPQGYIDIGKMLSKPKDIVVDLEELAGIQNSEVALVNLLGSYYSTTIKPSLLTQYLNYLKTDDNKWRYLLWFN